VQKKMGEFILRRNCPGAYLVVDDIVMKQRGVNSSDGGYGPQAK
jgi:hypothetical protein